jgi:hypothetical protein
MHDGLFCIADLTVAEKRLASCLQSSEIGISEGTVDELLCVVAEQCPIPSELLPECRMDLFFVDTIERLEESELIPFARDVLRGLIDGTPELADYEQRLDLAISTALWGFLSSKRGLIELRAQPGCERSVVEVMRHYDSAVSVIVEELPSLLAQFRANGRIKPHRAAKRFDPDAHIDGASFYEL